MTSSETEQGFEPGVGALLRASRLRCGEELRDVVSILRIRYPYLEAIEDGRYQDLPGIAYAVGFVRTYAEHLGLDADEVVRRFKAETESLERRSDLAFPSPIPERGTPGAAIVFVGILVAAVAYGAWYVGTSEESFFDGLVSPLPDRLATLLPGDDADGDQSAAPSEVTVTPGNAAVPVPALETVVPEPAPEPAPETESTPATMPETAEQVPEQTPEPAPMEDQPQADAEMTAPEVTAEAPEPPTLPSAPEAQPAAPEVAETTETPATPETEAPEIVAGLTSEAPVEPLSEGTAATSEPTPTVAEVVPSQPVEAPAPAETPEPVATPEPAVTAVPVPVAEAPAETLPVAPVTVESAEPPLAETSAEGQAAPASETAVAEALPPEAPQADTAQPQPQPSSEPVAETTPIAESEAEETVAAPVGGQQTDETAQQAALPDAAEAEAPDVAAPAEAVVTGGESRIVVRAKSDSWIQVRDGIARRLLVTRLLRAGDSYRVPNQPGLTLLTGNAGALDILVDGEAVDPIGTEGTVRRNVALDAERLQAGTAVLD